jgi:hypothetical protein
MARIIGFAVLKIVNLYNGILISPLMCGADLSDLDDIDHKMKQKANASKEDVRTGELIRKKESES